MAKKSRPTFQKLNKEKARQQKQKDKAARRLQAKQRRISAKSGMSDTTPEMAGTPPGPQPLLVSRERESDHG
jgi:hypothetical protein